MGTTTASGNAASGATLVLAMSLELGASEWKMAFSPGLGQQPRHRGVAAGDLEAVKKEIAAAKARFKLPADVRVASCYEAGRGGVWGPPAAGRAGGGKPRGGPGGGGGERR